jgi:hypothetical protein
MISLKRIVGAGIVFVLVAGALVIFSASSPTATPDPWPTLKAATTPDPTTIDDIKTLVSRYFDITGEAAGTFDLSPFPSIFIDDSTVTLNSNQIAFMARVGATGTGLLSYELAFFTDWKQGAEKLEQLQTQLKAENRAMTAADLKSISGSNGAPAPRRQEPMHKTMLNFHGFIIDGSRAIVEYESPSVTQKMFLVKIKDGWRIAGLQTLEVHV